MYLEIDELPNKVKVGAEHKSVGLHDLKVLALNSLESRARIAEPKDSLHPALRLNHAV